MHIYCSNCGAKNDYANAMKTKVCVKCEKPLTKSRPKTKISSVPTKIEGAREFGQKIPSIDKLEVDIKVIKARSFTLGDVLTPPDAKA
jgi:hypothetical protein